MNAHPRRSAAASAAVHHLPQPDTSAADRALAVQVRRWEAHLSDILDSCSVMSTLMDAFLSTPDDPDAETYRLGDAQVRQLYFCMSQSRNLAEEFRNQYYEALNKSQAA